MDAHDGCIRMDNKIWRMQDEEADEISIITYSTVHMTQPKHNKNIDFFYQDADDASFFHNERSLS